METVAKHKLRAKCGMVYSPSSAIDRLKLFAGRAEEVKQVARAITTRGRHAILWGEPGVGKTSLALVLKELFADFEGLKVVKVNCVGTDTFNSVWMRSLSEIDVIHEPTSPNSVEEFTLSQYVDPNRELSSGDVGVLLRRVSNVDYSLIMIFDEFNRLDPAHRALFADAIKNLSDDSLNVTIMLVGVARDVNELMAEHPSISRCLSQIKMPPMSDDELKEIMDRANKELAMTIDDDAVKLIIGLSQGFPHYTHLIAQESTYHAIDANRLNVTLDDVNHGIAASLDGIDHTLRTAYRKAADGQRKGTLFPQVLLACALAEVNDIGEFSSGGVREALQRITGEKYEIPSFSPHLNKMSIDASRGPILERSGSTRRFRFKFRNPLLRPFILMNGLKEGVISGDVVSHWKRKPKTGETPQLFPR